MKFAVVVFPGSNCDHDAYHAAKHVLGQDARFVWHKETSLGGADVVILPGRVLARRLPAHRRHRAVLADHDGGRASSPTRGGPVLGICNGFQILLECGLLPGAMLRNRDVKFHCEFVSVRVERTDTPFTRRAAAGQVLRLPIAHGEGNYYAPPETIAELEAERAASSSGTSTRDGEATDAANPNGSLNNIAGICNEGAQRRRPDAASGARLRTGARQHATAWCCSSRSSQAVADRGAVQAVAR